MTGLEDVRPTLNLDELWPHPLQAEFYDGCSEADDDVLAADLKTNGQRDPIVVLPPNNAAGLPAFTILDGHRRLEILRKLGRTQATVRVRDDLADADEAMVEAEFLRANFLRRQLHPLDTARVALRLVKIERKRPRDRMSWDDETEARDRVGRLMKMSGRNLQRYWRVLSTPVSVQRAVRDGHITLVQGDKIAGLQAERQKQIATAIERAPERAKQIVAEFVGVRTKRNQSDDDDGTASRWRSLKTVVATLKDRAKQLPGSHGLAILPLLFDADQLIVQLSRRIAAEGSNAE